MTRIEIEHEDHTESIKESIKDESDDELVNELVEGAVKGDVIKAKDELIEQELNKPVKQLTKSERETIINEFNNGVDNKYYKCHKLKNGSIRITKRANPLTNNAEEAHETVNKKIDNKLNTKRLTDNQLLLEHIIDLEKRYEVMRMKHKKLKKRYNKLECDLFEDDGLADSDEPLDVKEITNEPTIEPTGDLRIEQHVEPSVEPSIRTVKRPIKKGSWRSVISSF